MIKQRVAELKVLLIGADPAPPGGGPRRRAVRWTLALAAAAYLAVGATDYLDRKSGLPMVLCVLGGLALASPAALVVTRPLLAWRVAVGTALVTGLAVQTHHHTPFSWHPGILVLQWVLLVVIAVRVPFPVAAWAWASMAALVCVSFYPADRVQLIVLTAALMGTAVLIRTVASARTRNIGSTHVAARERGLPAR